MEAVHVISGWRKGPQRLFSIVLVDSKSLQGNSKVLLTTSPYFLLFSFYSISNNSTVLLLFSLIFFCQFFLFCPHD